MKFAPGRTEWARQQGNPAIVLIFKFQERRATQWQATQWRATKWRATRGAPLARRLLRNKLSAGLAALLALAVFATQTARAAEEAAGNSPLLYTSVPKSLLGPLEKSFEKNHPGWRLRVFRARAGTVIDRIESEWREGRARADVLWAGDASLFAAYKKAGRLSPYSPPGASAIPPDLKDPDGFYHAVRLFHLIVVHNKNALVPTPKGFADLVRPIPRKKKAVPDLIARPPPSKSGASRAGFFAWSRSPDLGWTFLRSLILGHPEFGESFGAAAELLGRSEARGAVLADFIAYRLAKRRKRIEIVWPAEGAVTISGPAGIVKKTGPAGNVGKAAENPGARRLADFLLSKPAQEIIRKSGLYAARTDISPPEGRPPLDKIKRMPVAWEELPAAEQELLSRVGGLISLAKRDAKKKK